MRLIQFVLLLAVTILTEVSSASAKKRINKPDVEPNLSNTQKEDAQLVILANEDQLASKQTKKRAVDIQIVKSIPEIILPSISIEKSHYVVPYYHHHHHHHHGLYYHNFHPLKQVSVSVGKRSVPEPPLAIRKCEHHSHLEKRENRREPHPESDRSEEPHREHYHGGAYEIAYGTKIDPSKMKHHEENSHKDVMHREPHFDVLHPEIPHHGEHQNDGLYAFHNLRKVQPQERAVAKRKEVHHVSQPHHEVHHRPQSPHHVERHPKEVHHRPQSPHHVEHHPKEVHHRPQSPHYVEHHPKEVHHRPQSPHYVEHHPKEMHHRPQSPHHVEHHPKEMHHRSRGEYRHSGSSEKEHHTRPRFEEHKSRETVHYVDRAQHNYGRSSEFRIDTHKEHHHTEHLRKKEIMKRKEVHMPHPKETHHMEHDEVHLDDGSFGSRIQTQEQPKEDHHRGAMPHSTKNRLHY